MKLIFMIRKLLLVPPATIGKEDAVLIARSFCSEKGYFWLESIEIEERIRCYRIKFVTGRRPTAGWFDVNIHTGKIDRHVYPNEGAR